jgi:hypothetical protein
MRFDIPLSHKATSHYYDVHEHPVATVEVLAVGVKRRNIIMIGGEEISL